MGRRMKERLVFAGQVLIVSTCALMIGVKVVEAVKLIVGWVS